MEKYKNSELYHKIMEGINRASPEEERKEFAKRKTTSEVTGNPLSDDFRWGEFKYPKAYVNMPKLIHGGAGKNVEDEMIFGEALHNLKNSLPEEYKKLRDAADNDPIVQEWLRESHEHEKDKRSFEKYVDESRFDQILGGYILGGEDSSIPTMRNWKRGEKYGKHFKNAIETFLKKLNPGVVNEK